MWTSPLFRLFCVGLASACIWSGAASAQPGFTSLFDGRSLAGWVLPEGPDAANFSVEGGAIAIRGASGWVHTERTYGDFTLRASVRFRKTGQLGNSGIFMRSPETSRFAGRWPGKSFEIEARDMAGNTALSPPWIGQVLRLGGDGGRAPEGVGTFDAAAALGAFRPGDWNDFEIVAHGPRIWTFLNGVLVSSVDGVDHPRGHIGLQAETGEIEWRGISIREHPPEQGAQSLLAAGLPGWRVEGGAAAMVRDGALALTKGGPTLRSVRSYGDFTLRFDYRAEDDAAVADLLLRSGEAPPVSGEDGVAVRLRAMSTARNGGPPTLVGDPRWPGAVTRADAPLGHASYDSTAGLAAAAPGVWRKAEIAVTGEEITVAIDGRVVSRARGVPRPRGGRLVLKPVDGTVVLRGLTIEDRMGE